MLLALSPAPLARPWDALEPVALASTSREEPAVTKLCAGRKLLVVPPASDSNDWDAAPHPFAPSASAGVPCLGEVCEEYAAQCAASSWTMSFLNISKHATKALASARLLYGAADPHPCVTYDESHPRIAAVVEGVAPFNGSGPAVSLPAARRFLYGAKVSMDIFQRGKVSNEDRDYPRRVIPFAGLNRGIFVRPYAEHPWPRQLRDGTLEHVYGWPIGMDSAFTPSSEACLVGWQNVLRSKPLPPLMLDEAQATASKPQDARVFIAATVGGASHGLANCLRDMLREASATLPPRICAVDPSDVEKATGGAGVGCGYNVSGAVPCDDSTAMLSFSSMFFGATFALLPAGDALDRDEAMLQALEGGAIPTFFGGNSRGDLARDAYSRTLMGTVDADSWSILIDDQAARIAGAVELRKVLTYNGAEAKLDVLDATGAPIFHATASSDGICQPFNATRAGEELVAILGAVPRQQVESMKEVIVESLPARISMLQQRTAGIDFVDRLVLAMISADTTAPRLPGNQSGGSLLTWPVGI